MNLSSATIKFMLARMDRIQPEIDNCGTETKVFFSDIRILLEDEYRKAVIDEEATATFSRVSNLNK